MKKYNEQKFEGFTFAKGQVWRGNNAVETYRLIDSVWVDKERDNELRIMSRYVDPTGTHVWEMVLHDTTILTKNFWLDPMGVQ